MSTAPAPEAFAAFSEGLSLILNHWTALRLAVQFCEEGDGVEKAENIIQETIGWFSDYWTDADENELADYFTEVLDSDFHVSIEDDSDLEVSRACIMLCQELLRTQPPSMAMLEHLRSLPIKPITEVGQLVAENQDADEEDEEQPAAEPAKAEYTGPAKVVDDDGWVTVESRSDRKSRMRQ
ncbi:Pre-rRNA-processing protein TSR2 [Carpediemonas membranifera]|uniref:Pre-rRNA-processing protein TSR2 n=1 Tax=Carpediemonas membranifera TaxID=201153 RepID=A0A8J6ATG8_9EUKA|nr:Pre-rRNA-processing protein TSR2 [Carpediemonas membranifera]|eukprot:KAG9393688.1 Pre-rRNA-processing protein TSR2 [Carpediemonas membranifera]